MLLVLTIPALILAARFVKELPLNARAMFTRQLEVIVLGLGVLLVVTAMYNAAGQEWERALSSVGTVVLGIVLLVINRRGSHNI